MKDDYLIVLGEWNDGLHCQTRARDPGGVSLGLASLERDFSISVLTYTYIFSFHSF